MVCARTGALVGARDLAGFVSACRDIVRDSPHVHYAPIKLRNLVPLVEAARPSSWDWYLRNPSGPLPARWYDIAFSSSLNGGYFFPDPVTGETRQWQVNGSGSEALLGWISSLRVLDLLPGIDYAGHLHADIRAGGSQHLAAVEERLRDIPYAAERMAVFREFALVWMKCVAILNGAVATGLDGRVTARLDLGTVDLLVRIMPNSFGGDPFRKKANLAVLLLASHLAAHGHDVACDIPIPADYQIPRILSWSGAIAVSTEFRSLLLNGRLLDQHSPEVTDFRAAAVVAAHDLGKLTGVPDWMVDCALFNAVRKDQAFKADSLPPMKIRGMWF